MSAVDPSAPTRGDGRSGWCLTRPAGGTDLDHAHCAYDACTCTCHTRHNSATTERPVMGNIGTDRREIELEPLEPLEEPTAPVEAPAAPDREEVPA